MAHAEQVNMMQPTRTAGWWAAGLLMILAATGAHARAGQLDVTHQARIVAPGEVVLLTVTGPAGVADVRARAFGQTLPGFPGVASGTWHVLLGIDVDAAAGKYIVEIEARTAAGPISVTHPLTVARKQFGQRKLTVDSKYVTPPANVLPRIDREQRQLADLLVFAHKPGHHDPRETQCLESALLYTGRPVLLAAKPQPTLGRNVAIAWNGRLEASRAVNAALPFLAAAEQVRILTLRTGDSAGDHGERLVQALAWRGIAAGVSVIEPEGSPPFAALTRRAAETGTDLLVMGAYGHSRVREMILGGATRYVLNHDGPAVLLAH